MGLLHGYPSRTSKRLECQRYNEKESQDMEFVMTAVEGEE